MYKDEAESSLYIAEAVQYTPSPEADDGIPTTCYCGSQPEIATSHTHKDPGRSPTVLLGVAVMFTTKKFKEVKQSVQMLDRCLDVSLIRSRMLYLSTAVDSGFVMEEASSSDILEAEIVGISFALATHRQIRLASISDAGINHASQLSNSFLGLPLEFGKCESCGATEPDKCEGHFGYIHLPVPIYHPAHVSELKQMLSLLCLKCLKIKKIKSTSSGLAERLLGVCCEVKEILRRIPEETRKKLTAKGHIPQEGYILEYLPVPPNCLSVPEVSDGSSSMAVDPSRIELKDVLRKVIAINNSRSGETNFESHRAEANEMFRAVDTYLQVRGTAKPTRNIDMRFGLLFCSVITGDAFRNVNEVGIPMEIAHRITFEERVSVHNIGYLQELVDNKMCLSYTQADSAAGFRFFAVSEGYAGAGVLDKASAQQLAMYGSRSLPSPAVVKPSKSGPAWTFFQILQLAFPERLSCRGDGFIVGGSDLLSFDFGVDRWRL
ncbi:hypothetical protein Bca52824_042913 [Brassica carinata]|uniref:DNA-directed RNA polymerase n=1 Tax=Brassica carinata TaxID=52824 RepID=A0A8X7S2J5_BRACI|nr:hypothetical protein Bca52824_042913 [Brassica carinata]